MDTAHIVPLLFVCLIAWRIYIRARRNIGRQPLQPKRMVVRIVIFAVVTCGLAVFSFFNPRLLIGLGAGLALGAPLALLGLKLTQFETTTQGQFYTPNSAIGVALTVLLVGRVAYRMMLLSTASRNPGQPPAFMQSALSFCVFGILAGYYVAYYIGVLAQSRKAPST
jgi:hypothetical protein